MLVAGKSNPGMHKPPRDLEDGPCGVLQVLDLTNKHCCTKEAETTSGEALRACSQASQISDGVRSQRALRILDSIFASPLAMVMA